MVLMIDNYDSFTYNIVQYFMEMGESVKVFRNDKITVEEARDMEFDYLVISPGPGRPENAGCSMEMIKEFSGKKPILGVCLGHQSIAQAFGANIVQAGRIMHGKSDLVNHDGKSVFSGLPNPMKVIRYHSLAIDGDTLPDEFEITSRSSDDEIMSIKHKTLRIEGVQFHPESIGTEAGKKMLANFLSGIKEIPPVRTLLKNVLSGEDLKREEAAHLMEMMTTGSLTSAQTGSLLTALSIKGETVDELTGFAEILKAKAEPVPVPSGIPLTDTCGTGGDSSGSFNISTTAAFVAAGAGVAIAKHGNRSITSKSGSADVLGELGVKIDLGPEDAAAALEESGVCFLFAPKYHSAFKHVMGPRKELGFRTFFNLLGPMLNPAGVESQVMGVFSSDLTEKIAKVLGNLGVKHALVVHGSDGLDEITLTGVSKISELKDGWVRTYEFDPESVGMKYCTLKDLKGGDASENAEITRRILSGEKGPQRDIVVLNAAAAIIAANIAADFPAAIALAKASIDSGSAIARLDSLINFGSGDN